MSELLDSLGIEWYLLVAQIINFAILLVILEKFVYRPVMRLLDERRAKIADTLARDKMSAEKLEAVELDREKILSKARAESQRIIESAKQSGEEAGKRLLASAKEEVSRLKKETEKRLAAERTRLVADVRKEIGTVVVEAIERSLGDVLDARTQGRMVEQALVAIREGEKKI